MEEADENFSRTGTRVLKEIYLGKKNLCKTQIYNMNFNLKTKKFHLILYSVI